MLNAPNKSKRRHRGQLIVAREMNESLDVDGLALAKEA